MKRWHSAVQTGLVAALSLASAFTWAGSISTNFTATSNYIWRGVSQTNDQAAIQGGADYTINKNFYAGAWTSNVKSGNTGDYELDLYGGYTDKFGEFNFDAGVITYQYPGKAGIDDFTEAFAGATYKNFSAKISFDISESDIYLEGAADFDLPDKYLLTAHIGVYNYDRAGYTDYNDYSATLSKGELSFMVSDTDLSNDNIKVNISWNKTF